ncbi:MAG TPA: DUF2188 domain-containing protein [Roseiarcus sp.]|nr:DUF2188 domain-containing protein [Roseiarcus sp.]
MGKVVYEIVAHDGGWAYKVGDAFSETYPSHDLARAAAERAASEQRLSGETTDIQYEDDKGRWRTETTLGQDRPETEVEG